MNIDKYRKSKWLKKEDVLALPLAQRRTLVERIVEEEVADEPQPKPACYFKGIDKAWLINMTGLEVLEEITGSRETNNYAGAAVELYVDPNVRYQNKKVGGIKIRARKADDDIDPAMPTLEGDVL